MFTSLCKRLKLNSNTTIPSLSQLYINCNRHISTYTTHCGIIGEKGLPKSFDKILIANRGEIACRIIRTCRELGVKTVAVYSDADANAMHVKMADEAQYLGPPPASQSYLLMDNILDIAKRTGAQAIHPGYGFLSENDKFAEACVAAGIEFIGPPPQAMRDMGDKSASKKIMEAARVPIVPGYHGSDQSLAKFHKEAEKMGYPVMLKAVAGGGGKGIRPVFDPSELEVNIFDAKRESLNSFSNDNLLIEKYVSNARHIEFQVFADKHGNAVHLFERDCSVQRGNQKVFEESPAPGLTPQLRAQMGKSATEAALAVDYVGAGTVEFLVDPDTYAYYFMEMNTRLQVEHPVTEMIVNRDLVQWQLHAAAGHPLPATQDDIQLNGHAIEARIYAEDPNKNFQASPGKIYHLSYPERVPHSVRVETGVEAGGEVTPYYDAMIAKLIVHSDDSRSDALNKMHACLQQFEVSGIQTNIEFLKRVLNNPSFQKGGITTDFIPQHRNQLFIDSAPSDRAIIIGAAAKILLSRRGIEYQSTHYNRWFADSEFTGFSTIATRDGDNGIWNNLRLIGNDEKLHKVKVFFRNNGSMTIKFDGKTYEINGAELDDNTDIIRLRLPDSSVTYQLSFHGSKCTVFCDGTRYDFEYPQYELQFEPEFEPSLNGIVLADLSEMDAPVIKIKASMSCTVSSVRVANGQHVTKGDVLAKVEAMKQLQDIKAPCDGIVTEVSATDGQPLQPGEMLLKVSRDETVVDHTHDPVE